MTANPNTTQNAVTGAPSQGAQAPSPSNSFFMQMSSGPAAVVFALAGESLELMSSLMSLNSKTAQAETTNTLAMAQAASQETISAANMQAIGYITQAVGSFGNAGITLGTTFQETNATAADREQLGPLEEQMAQYKGLSELQQAPARVEAEIGEEGILPAREGNIGAQQLAEELAARPSAALYADKSDVQDAINTMSPEEYRAFQDWVDNKITDTTKQINTLTTRMSSTQQQIGQYGSMFGQVANGLSQSGQSYTTWQQGKHQAAQQLDSAIQQVQNSTAQNAVGMISTFFSQVADILASAKQAAQAYATNM